MLLRMRSELVVRPVPIPDPHGEERGNAARLEQWGHRVTHAAVTKPHIPNTATARIGEPVPSRHFIGRPMKVNGPSPKMDSRLHRLSMWVMPRSKQALCTKRFSLPSGPGRIESMPKCTMPCFASHSVAGTFTPEFSVAYSLRGKVRS